ncbi:MAG: DUF190 domain-containing protein [Nevskiaceae bacterium]|nr:MAG: DUF190 domain-containing protein [Nevskiaceae bacterium]TBR72697.1 MAG: DUF190 domain-containing protein [Nevskiaceae bacterium]
MPKTVKLARVYITEGRRDKQDGNLFHVLFKLLHNEHHIRAMTVFRGVAGFSTHGAIHASDLLRLTADLPLVLEFYDDPDKVDAAIETIKPHLAPGHIVTWMVECQ